MSVYQYVADNDPRGTQQLIESFGYEITDRRNLGRSLSELVSSVGEPALKKVMDMHPDKDIILEYNVSLSPSTNSCGCNSCKAKGNYDNYKNASGDETLTASGTNQTQANNTHLIANQTNVILVVATLFIVSALILKNR